MTLNAQSVPDPSMPWVSLFNTQAFYDLRSMLWLETPLFAGSDHVGTFVTAFDADQQRVSGRFAPYGGTDWVGERLPPERVDEALAVLPFISKDHLVVKCAPTHRTSANAVALVALHRLGFRAKSSELSYWIPLPTSGEGALVDQYVGGLKHAARAALARTEDLFVTRVIGPRDEECWAYGYDVLASNREAKGRRMSFSRDYMLAIRDAFPGLVRMLVTMDGHGVVVAAALVYRVSRGHDYVQNWGHDASLGGPSPMNVLARDCVAHSLATGAVALDLGVSSNDGVPDAGLCRFKRSVGAVPEVKWVLVR